ncbi:MAG: DNA polymerase-3 subunit chi [Oceanicoccus sp.]|jgi:DNA polymerase-3 subunit chi
MTKIDFYILADNTPTQRYIFACRLVEKAYKLGNHVYIHADSESDVNIIDEQLWSFRKTSFVPHTREIEDLHAQIIVGYGEGSQAHSGLLINLSKSVPDIFSRFERVSEIVVQDQAITASTRENYRFYRDRGYHLSSHDLRNKT